MKKKLGIIALCCVTLIGMIGFTGCGGDDNPYNGLDLSQYVKVGKYKGLTVDKVKVKVAKSDIADAINEDIDAAKEETDVETGKKVKDGDTVKIDYVGKVDGKTFDGGSAEDYELEIGSGTFIDGFEEGLVGHKVGEKNIKLNLAFPLDYSEESLQGKDVVFTVTINSATREAKPEYDDAFAQSQGDYKNIDEYEAAVKKEVYKEKKEEAESEQKSTLWNKVLENSEVKKYPQEILDSYIETFDAQVDYYAEQAGSDRETIMAQYFGVSTEKELQKTLKKSAKALVKQEMIIEYIAEKEDITYTKDDVEELEKSIEDQGYDEDAVQQQTGRTMDQYARIELLYEGVQDLLLDNAKIK